MALKIVTKAAIAAASGQSVTEPIQIQPAEEVEEVGYGQPPKRTRFKAGQSGNPKGRPKGVRKLSADVAAELAQKLSITENGKPSKITKQQAMIKSLMAKALKGDVRAIIQLIGLTPMAEQSRDAVIAAHTLNASDQEILEAMRKKLRHDSGSGS